MTRPRSLAIVGVGTTAVAGCLLADPIDAPKCPPGSHPELQRCVLDDSASKRIKIIGADGGTSCSDPAALRPPVVEPATFDVTSGEEFMFENTDVIDHEIRGAAGDAWLTVSAGQLSSFTSITKQGTWPYRVSGCPGGTVVVE